MKTFLRLFTTHSATIICTPEPSATAIFTGIPLRKNNGRRKNDTLYNAAAFSFTPAPDAEITKSSNTNCYMKSSLVKSKFFGVLFPIFSLLFVSQAFGQKFAVASGNWNDAIWATSSNGAAGSAAMPVSSDVVTVNGGITVMLNINSASCASISINPSDNNLTGTLSFTSNGVLTVSGNVMLGDNSTSVGKLDMTNGGTLQLAGGFNLNSANSVFVPGSGTINYNGAAQSISLLTYNNLTLSGSGTKTMPVGALSIGGNFTTSGTCSTTAQGPMAIGGNVTLSSVFTAGSFTHTVGGSWTRNGASAVFIAIGSTIDFAGSGPGVISAANFDNIRFSGSGAKSSASSIGITGNIDIVNNFSASSISVGGNWTNTGSFSSGTVDFTSGGTQTVASGNSSFSTLTHSGSGTLKLLTNALTVSQQLNNNAGTLDLNGLAVDATYLWGSGGIITSSVTGPVTITVGLNSINGSVTDYNGTIQNGVGTVSLTKIGAGSLNLSGNNTYSGTTLLSAGKLGINSSTALGTSVLNITAGAALGNSSGAAIILVNNNTQLWNGDFSFNGPNDLNLGTGSATLNATRQVSVTAGTFTVGGAILGSGFGLTKVGNGTLMLAGVNSYNGITTVSAGTLTLAGVANGNSTIAGNIIINGGVLSLLNSNEQIANTSNLTLSSGAFSLGTITETIGALTMSGGALTRGGGTLTLSSASSITGGTLTFSSASGSHLVTNSTLALGGATFDFTSGSSGTNNFILGGDVTYAASNTAPAKFTNNGGGTPELQIGNGVTRTYTIAQASLTGQPEVQIDWLVRQGAGAASLIKAGTGTLLFSNSFNFTGPTTISAGTLRLNPIANISPASQIVLNGGSLSTAGISAGRTITNSSTFKLDANSTLTLGSNAHSFSFANSSGITWVAGRSLTINGWTGTGGSSGTAGKIFFGSNSSSLTSAQLQMISFNGYIGTPVLLSTGELVPAVQCTIPAFSINPSDIAVCTGTGASFTIVSSGSPAPTFQWQVSTDGGANYTNVTEGGVYSGTTAATLIISNSTGLNNNKYRAVATNTCGSVNSNAATLTVNSNFAGSASSTPELCINTSLTNIMLTTTGATGIGAPSGLPAGVTAAWASNQITIDGTPTEAGTFYYSIPLTGGCGTINAIGTITVTKAPTMPGAVTGPATVCTGSSNNYGISLVSGATSYTWTVPTGWSITGGQGTTSITVTAGNFGQDVNISVTASNNCGTSSASTLAVAVSAVTMATFTPVPSSPVCSGTSITYTTQPGKTNYLWTLSGLEGADYIITSGGTGTGSNIATLKWLTAGFKTVAVTYTSGMCPAIPASSIITVNASPSEFTVTGGGTYCAGGTGVAINLSGSETGVNYQLMNGTTTVSSPVAGTGSAIIFNNITAAGSYTVVTINATTFCASTMNGSASVSIMPRSSANITSTNLAICNGSSTDITGTVSATGAWVLTLSNGGGFITSPAGTTSFSKNVTPSGNTTIYAITSLTDEGSCPAITSGLTGSTTVMMNGAPDINTQPSNSVITYGDNTGFTVAAPGTASFQWQVSTGGPFTNITNDGVYSGATTANLSLTKPGYELNGYQYRVVITGGCGATTSDAVTLAVNRKALTPSITANNKVYDGNTTATLATQTLSGIVSPDIVTLLAAAANFNDATPATGKTVTATGLTLSGADAPNYVLSATTATTTASITQGSLDVDPAVGLPDVNRPDANKLLQDDVIDLDIPLFNITQFNALPAGAATVQIDLGSKFVLAPLFNVNTVLPAYFNWSTSTGSTGNVILTGTLINDLPAQFDGDAVFKIKANGSGTSKVSASFLITNSTLNDIQPGNNNAELTYTILAYPAATMSSVNTAICIGNSTSITGSVSASGVWTVTLSDGSIASGSGNGTFSIAVSPMATTTYTVASASDGNYTSVTTGHSGSTAVTVNNPPAITSAPQSVVSCLGQSTTFSVTATGTGLTYQWRRGGVDIGGATASGYTIPSVALSDVSSYNVAIGGTCAPAVISAPVTLTLSTSTVTVIQNAGGSIAPGTSIINCGANQTFTITADACYHIVDVLVDGVSVPAAAASGSYTFNNVQANHTIAATYAINTYMVTVASGSNGTVTPGTGTVNCGNNAAYTITPASCYHIADVLVDGVSNAAAIANGTYTFNNVQETHAISATFALNAYSITTQPVDQTITYGTSVSFSVTATGPSLQYQWQQDAGTGFTNLSDGGIYSGTSTATVIMSKAAAAMSGYKYRVSIIGTCPSNSTSGEVTLTVNKAPVTITANNKSRQVGNVNPVFAGTVTGIISTDDVTAFYSTVADAGSPAGTYPIVPLIGGADAGNYNPTYNNGTLTVTSLLLINVTSTVNNACHGGSAGQIKVSASGGTLPYIYMLSPTAGNTSGAMSGIFTGLAAGTYTVTVTDANGDTKTTNNITITEPAGTVPDITLGSDFSSGLFSANGAENTIVYNITEIGGNPAGGVILRITKPSNYSIAFDQSLASTTVNGTGYTLDNGRWSVASTAGNFITLTLNNDAANGNSISCSKRIYLAIKVKRNTPNISKFNISAQLLQAIGEITLINNNNSILFTAE